MSFLKDLFYRVFPDENPLSSDLELNESMNLNIKPKSLNWLQVDNNLFKSKSLSYMYFIKVSTSLKNSKEYILEIYHLYKDPEKNNPINELFSTFEEAVSRANEFHYIDFNSYIEEVDLSEKPKWIHKKRGTIYQELGDAELQIASGIVLKEGDILRVYKDANGKLWVREVNEFQDGRFEELK